MRKQATLFAFWELSRGIAPAQDESLADFELRSGDDGLVLLAEPLDAELDFVSRL